MTQATVIEIVGQIGLLQTEDFSIEMIGEEYSIHMKVEDPGGYKRVVAERLVPSLITLMQDLSHE